MSNFVRNPKLHVVRVKETRTPEVLTINGRAEVVMMDIETYESFVERVRNSEAVSYLRMHMAQARRNVPPRLEMTDAEKKAEIKRRQAVIIELVEETERLSLYNE